MINVMNSLKDPIKGGQEKGLDPQLWHACAGAMVRMPPVNAKVFYFPQGHTENAYERVDFGDLRIPSMILCKVLDIKYMADAESDEVFAQIMLMPLKGNAFDYEEGSDEGGFGGDSKLFESNNEKTPSFAKTLTQSDANNGGGFSVPRYCAETIFPRLDYNADPPVQTILAKDVHRHVWKFRHIYRGTPRRHLLTTGWSNFVNQKKLVAGDSIVFMRAENGDLCVGVRRAKRGGIGGGPEYSAGWNPIGGSCGYTSLLREDEGGNTKRSCCKKGKVTAESVVEAVTLAISGRPFEVVYYPRACSSEFCVKASDVAASMQISWCSGMRFKMAFETEDSSRISWFMGTVSAVNVVDTMRWPNSPWRLLQVAWDEPDLLQNVKRVNPWLVEVVSNMPTIPFAPYSPPRKKMRLPQHPDYNLMSSIPIPTFSGNHMGSGSPFDNAPVGLQGARHAQYELSSSDLYHFNRLPSGFFPIGFQGFDRSAPPRGFLPHGNTLRNSANNDKGSCLLTLGSSAHVNSDSTKPHIVLFGKLILPEQPKSQNESADTVTRNASSDVNPEKTPISSGGSNQNGTREISPSEEGSHCSKDNDEGHCKVFMESDDVDRTLDLSVLGSY